MDYSITLIFVLMSANTHTLLGLLSKLAQKLISHSLSFFPFPSFHDVFTDSVYKRRNASRETTLFLIDVRIL